MKVQIIDPILRQRNGDFMHVGREMALKGVRRGKWKIVESQEDRELRATAGGGDYLTRGGFSDKPTEERNETMKFEDLYGIKKEDAKIGMGGEE